MEPPLQLPPTPHCPERLNPHQPRSQPHKEVQVVPAQGSPTRETVTCGDYSPALGAPPQPAHRPDLGRCSQAAEDQGGDQPKMSPTVTQSGPGRLIQGGMRGFSTHLGGRRGRRRRRACHTIFSISQNDTQRYKLATNTARLADTHILRTTITIDSTQ